MQTTTVELKDIGPIEHAAINLREGAITVLEGPNGAGKSIALNAVEKLTTGRGPSLTTRDGADDGGSIEGFGATIRVSRKGSNRKSGQLVVDNIEDDFSIASLVDPGVKDPVAADVRRIKALVALSGEPADISRFAGLAKSPEDLAKIVNPETFGADDLVDMAARVKRDFEAASRERMRVAEQYRADAEAKRKLAGELDLTAPHDADELQAALEEAVRTCSSLTEARRNGLEVRDRADRARRSLEESEAGYSGLSIDAADAALDAAVGERSKAENRCIELRRLLAEAEKEFESCCATADAAQLRLEGAQNHAAAIAGWKETIEAAEQIDLPTAEAVDAAEKDVLTARSAVETGVRIRDALRSIQESDHLEAHAEESENDAQFLRESGLKTADVLSGVVSGMGSAFSVGNDDDGVTRLMVRHRVRGLVPYSELSDGERWCLAIDTLLEQAKRKQIEHAVLAIPQIAWEGLDHSNRSLIAQHVAATNLFVLAVQASRDNDATELKSFFYGANGESREVDNRSN